MATTVNENNSQLFKAVLKQVKAEEIPYIFSFSEDKQRCICKNVKSGEY